MPIQENPHDAIHDQREITGAGDRSAKTLCAASKHSNAVPAELAPGIKWRHSYVAANEIYCVYNAASEQLIREHAESRDSRLIRSPISAVIDPSTAKG
ncbi:nickel-binding protein [Pseudomonas sp. EA_105y_Pfl2_R69]|uniref:nickel-binding protein n=1 Tax=Pseudomonas sp. EA_105y_Pfl2_R69 TaxID=3088683 RepID=UPI0030D73FFB